MHHQQDCKIGVVDQYSNYFERDTVSVLDTEMKMMRLGVSRDWLDCCVVMCYLFLEAVETFSLVR